MVDESLTFFEQQAANFASTTTCTYTHVTTGIFLSVSWKSKSHQRWKHHQNIVSMNLQFKARCRYFSCLYRILLLGNKLPEAFERTFSHYLSLAYYAITRDPKRSQRRARNVTGQPLQRPQPSPPWRPQSPIFSPAWPRFLDKKYISALFVSAFFSYEGSWYLRHNQLVLVPNIYFEIRIIIEWWIKTNSNSDGVGKKLNTFINSELLNLCTTTCTVDKLDKF